MDVTCERCETEYEFDETLVSERGTTVKCTQCGHLFKVYPPGGGSAAPWRVRTSDGREETLATLRELQRRITRGELTEGDLISRDGTSWKRLGDIAELESFFRAAREKRSREPSAPALAPPPPSPAEAAWEAMPTVPGDRRIKRTVLGMGAPAPREVGQGPRATPRPDTLEGPSAIASRGAATATPPPPPPAPPPQAANTPAGGWVDGPGLPPDTTAATAPTLPDVPTDAPVLPRLDTPQASAPGGAPALPRLEGATAPPSGATPSARPPSEFPEIPGLSPRRGGAARWLFLVAMIALLGGGLWVTRSRWMPLLLPDEEASPVARFLARGDAALSEDHPEAYERALREYTRASAIAENEPKVFLRMAWAEALHAHALRLHAADLRARSTNDPSVLGEAKAIQREAERHATEAMRWVERARILSKGHPLPSLDHVTALTSFVAGDGSSGDAALARLREEEPPFPGAVEWLEALRTVEPDGRVPSETLEPARNAVRKAPGLIRARLLLTRAALAAHRIDEAKGALEAVLAKSPRHPEARALLRAIERGLPPAPPLLATMDASTPEAAVTTRPDAGPPPAAPEHTERPSPAPPTAPPSHEPPTQVSEANFDELLRKGERLQERGRSAEARKYFQRALQLRPESPEALVGLGYVALDQGRRGEALGYFRRAAAKGYAEGFFGLGETYESTGRLEEALEGYEGYLARHPNGPSAPIARRKVAELQAQLGTQRQTDTPSPAPSGAPPSSPTPTPPSTEPSSPPTAAAPPTAPNELPAPRGVDPNTIPQSDPPAVGSE